VELLVAMGVFMVLGATLVLLLRGGLSTWRAGEARRESYEEAMTILDQIAEDLHSVHTKSPPGGEGSQSALFLSDFDGQGRQRLFFVRTIRGESEGLVTGLAGTTMGAAGYFDLHEDRKEAVSGDLRATGGLCEVGYLMDPTGSDILLRGVRAPIGGKGSLFRKESVEAPERVARLFKPFSVKVLFLGFRFWTQYTNTWDGTRRPNLRAGSAGEAERGSAVGPAIRAAGRVRSGPLEIWDSTRAILEPPVDLEEDEFFPFVSAASLVDPRDDIFPEKVLVTLVVAEPDPAAAKTVLVKDIGANDREIPLFDTAKFPLEGKNRYVKIGAEWIRYEEIRKKRLVVTEGGRGARFTAAAPHDAGDDVTLGRTFRVVIRLPGGREDWKDRRWIGIMTPR
jgi:hypothetical protein